MPELLMGEKVGLSDSYLDWVSGVGLVINKKKWDFTSNSVSLIS